MELIKSADWSPRRQIHWPSSSYRPRNLSAGGRKFSPLRLLFAHELARSQLNNNNNRVNPSAGQVIETQSKKMRRPTRLGSPLATINQTAANQLLLHCPPGTVRPENQLVVVSAALSELADKQLWTTINKFRRIDEHFAWLYYPPGGWPSWLIEPAARRLPNSPKLIINSFRSRSSLSTLWPLSAPLQGLPSRIH